MQQSHEMIVQLTFFLTSSPAFLSTFMWVKRKPSTSSMVMNLGCTFSITTISCTCAQVPLKTSLTLHRHLSMLGCLV